MLQKYLEWISNHMDIILIEFIIWFIVIVILGIFVCSVLSIKYRKNKKLKSKKEGQKKDERKI
jgi:cbb3-type cytochrome oxidase subunit 3